MPRAGSAGFSSCARLASCLVSTAGQQDGNRDVLVRLLSVQVFAITDPCPALALLQGAGKQPGQPGKRD